MRRHVGRIAMALCMGLAALPLAASAANKSSSVSDASVTATAGESWLNHLHRSFGDTSMGKTERLGPPPAPDGSMPAGSNLGLVPSRAEKVTLRGADLYRFNCQGCHGESGEGAPPEINSLINPVRATSVPLVLERMKKRGVDISAADAAELAKQSQKALLDRIHSGGESMPAFPQLNEAETRALVAYLKQLAGVPGAPQTTITESPVRVGELIVKSTCHTCHDATGANPSPQQLEDGNIPPLETLPMRVDELQLIRKVTSGAPVLMGTPASLHRGRMPVFYYLSREEAADVYLYLTSYPPTLQRRADVAAVATTSQSGPKNGDDPARAKPPLPRPGSRGSSPPAISSSGRTNLNATAAGGLSDWAVTLLLIGLGSVAMGLAVAVLGFAAYELNRLGQAGEARQRRVSAMAQAEREVGELVIR